MKFPLLFMIPLLYLIGLFLTKQYEIFMIDANSSLFANALTTTFLLLVCLLSMVSGIAQTFGLIRVLNIKEQKH
ncbi:hypothetical protein AB3N04_01175 (plasmid) [Alkalihalophilus sp. As8PL]|uniref:Uncharacterized protein n=1 Tax=Alkalihalophilus sp. As8PL TaxID=3237103 RepID=A0AB39BMS6_9BACI